MCSWTPRVSLPEPMTKNMRVHGYSIEDEVAIAFSSFVLSRFLSRFREPELPTIDV